MSQEVFAEMADVSRNTIEKIESRLVVTRQSGGPELRTLIRITQVLGLPLSRFFATVEETVAAGGAGGST